VRKWIIFKFFVLLQILGYSYYFFTHSYHRNFLPSQC